LEDFRIWLAKYKWYALIAAIGLIPIGMLEWEFLLRNSGKDWIGFFDTGIDSFYAIAVILCFLSFDFIVVKGSNEIIEIGSRSFGIYLIHAPILLIVSRILYHVAPSALAFQFIYLALLVSLGLGIPLLLMSLVRKSQVKGLYHYLFG
jgi:peptidoglycan/LPS O-acetylase OafA/YrhL